jgi:D-psicose/D-tagatose/L-ribulose 3-epimerase
MTRFSFMVIDTPSVFANEASARSCFELVKSCGYEGIELNIARAVLDKLDLLTSLAAEHELRIPSFLTGAAYSEGLCLSSPDESLRQGAVDRLISYLDLAERFDAILVVGLLQGFTRDEPDLETALGRIVASLKQVAAAAEPRGVQFVMEPINHLQVGFNNSVAEVRQVVKDVGSDAFKPMVDTIHMNIEDQSITQPILDCGPDLRHVHLCESNGGLFGSGHIDFAAALKALDEIGYDGFASVKVYRKASMVEAARSSINLLRQL